MALIVALPLLYVLVRAFSSGLASYGETVWQPRTARLAWQTITLILGALTIAIPVALGAAWLVARTDLVARRFWAVALALPIVFPSYVVAFALVALFGPRGWLGSDRLGDWIYGYPGALIALSLFTYPYLYLLLVPALRRIDPALEESAQLLGRARWRVILPQLRAPIYAGSLLIVLYVISDFGAVSLLRYDTLTLAVYHAYRSLFDRSVAAAMATVLIALALVVILIASLLQLRLRPASAAAARPVRRRSLGRAQWAVQALLVSFAALTIVGPLSVILGWAFQALRAGNPLGEIGGAFLRSLFVALAAAVVASIAAFPVALASARYRSTFSRIIERACYAGYALPGLIVALSLVFASARHLPWLYQTTALLILGYTVRFLPQSLAATRSALDTVSTKYEEAGRVLGHGPTSVWRRITFPLIAPGMAAGAGLVFLTTMKELPATLILRPTGFDTLATQVWAAADEGIFSQAALPALALLLASVLPVWWLTIRPALAERNE